MVENAGIPSEIPRQRTYLEVESYLSDLLSLQDSKLRHQPNSMENYEDGQRQMAALTGLRATMHLFLNPKYRQGPFYLGLSDLHPNNIFVDDKWNIKTIIDLEWAGTLPVEMQTPPYWLTSRTIDGFKEASHFQEYKETLEEYLAVYEDEELKRNGSSWQADMQRQTWEKGSFWFFHAVRGVINR
ncbi:SET domain protein [Beauveria brongniartii RCEF 3172]|uniref:SET domain protein n=1 Tax=Beauveria brongniartii RCEF 3172 TaxID=1081107 RepID=A0A167CE36_9HYPO|nr:SET domain protein [Beauveria brongniartii RCEF 3172]